MGRCLERDRRVEVNWVELLQLNKGLGVRDRLSWKSEIQSTIENRDRNIGAQKAIWWTNN